MKFKALFLFLLMFLCSVECFGKSVPKNELKKQQSVSLQARQKIVEYELKRKDYIILISIPKCGTHLMTRILSLMPGKDLSFNPFDWEVLGVLDRREKAMISAIKDNAKLAPEYVMGMYHVPMAGPFPKAMLNRMRGKNTRSFDEHWPYTVEAEELFNQCTEANFFIIRDPRDMIVSLAYMIYKGPNKLEARIPDVILDLIDGRQKSFVSWANGIHAIYPLLYTYGVTNVYKLYLPWTQARKFITVRFEDLVGEEGGGSRSVQMNELKRIATHLKVSLSDEQHIELRNKIFGESSTFREGKIGSWRKYFTQEMIEAYKKTPGACQLLIDLGYEKDANW